MIVLRELIVVFLSVFVVFVAPAYAQNQTNQTQMQPQTYTWSTYEDPILGISIQYLNGSDINEEPDTVSFKYGLGAYYEFNTAVLTGQSYYKDSQEMMRDNMNAMRGDVAKINTIENTTLAGKPAYKVDFTSKPDPDTTDPQLLRAINYYMVDTENMTDATIIFRVGEEDYDSYQPVIQRMADSFTVL
jgi:hypothetical protein